MVHCSLGTSGFSFLATVGVYSMFLYVPGGYLEIYPVCWFFWTCPLAVIQPRLVDTFLINSTSLLLVFC
jgi:hypothetical protein